MHHAWLICVKDLRRRLRDRTALIVAVVAPLALTVLIGMSLSGSQGIHMGWESWTSTAPRSRMRSATLFSVHGSNGIVEVRQLASRSAAQAAVERRDVNCAVVIDQGFANAARDDQSKSIEILAGPAAFALEGTRALVEDFLERVAAKRVDQLPIAAVTPLSPGGSLRMIDFFAASMTVLFLTFAVLSGVRALQSEGPQPDYFAADGIAYRTDRNTGGKVCGASTRRAYPDERDDRGDFHPVRHQMGQSTSGCRAGCDQCADGDRLDRFPHEPCEKRGTGSRDGCARDRPALHRGRPLLPPQGLPDIFETLARLTPNGQAFYGFVDLSAAGSNGSIATIVQPLLFTGLVGVAGIVFATFRARSALQRIT